MRDGRTQKLEQHCEKHESFSEFLANWKAVIVVLSGEAAGTEYGLDQPKVSLGRGNDADLQFPDTAMSREHASLEFAEGGFRVRDLGSMNGILVNGSETKSADLKNGDRIRLGEHEFQFVLEENPRQPKTYVVDDA